MNYRKIYYSIIESARNETLNGNREIGYYEKHHILPKSLGGSNDYKNLVKLTAREHFICHWLLVKMYEKGTLERFKMLCAFSRMRSTNENHKRYINSRAYEYLRIEYANSMSLVMSKKQKGKLNSQYGSKWYTDRNTGETKLFKEPPTENFWIKGRNLFRNENSSIAAHFHSKSKDTRLEFAKSLWNEFHTGEYLSIRDFCRKTNKPLKRTTQLLSIIPAYSYVFTGRSHNNCSNKEFVNIFEA